MKKLLLLFLLLVWIINLQITNALTPVMCTEEAKLCPDGKTWVWRTWPSCQFSECPNIHPENPTVCTSEYAPVCGQRFPDWDEIGWITYKTFWNKCELSNYKKGFIFWYKGKCKDLWDNEIPKTCQTWYDWCNTCKRVWNAYACTKRMCFKQWTPKCLDTIIKHPPVSYSMRIKLDKLANKFLRKVEWKFWPETDKSILYIKQINIKLEDLSNKRPKYKNIINYLIKIFEREIDKLNKNGLDEIINILN